MYCVLSMWGKIMIPMYRLWLHDLYGLYGPRCLLSQKRPLTLISHSLSILQTIFCPSYHNGNNIMKIIIDTILRCVFQSSLSHWGRVTHICVGNLTIIGSDNGLSPSRRQAIIWTNAGILLIGSLGTNFSETLIGIQTFSYKKMHLKVPSAKWLPFCLGLNVLNQASLLAGLGGSTDNSATSRSPQLGKLGPASFWSCHITW